MYSAKSGKIADDGMRILTIDQGNSSAKAVVWEGNEPVISARIFEMSIEELLPLLESGEIDGCAYCSVGHKDAKFMETLRRMLEGRLLVLTPSTPLPIGVRYASCSTLGNDRVAAAAGAALLFPGEGLLVADAGTALTLDVVDSEGCFRGGNISPGLRMRFTSLHEATDRLPEVTEEGDVPTFGYDTTTAIRAGVAMGMTAEIRYAFEAARRLYGCGRLLLTGNDAPLLSELLKRDGIEGVADPNLVGLGLLSIFRYNLTAGAI